MRPQRTQNIVLRKHQGFQPRTALRLWSNTPSNRVSRCVGDKIALAFNHCLKNEAVRVETFTHAELGPTGGDGGDGDGKEGKLHFLLLIL